MEQITLRSASAVLLLIKKGEYQELAKITSFERRNQIHDLVYASDEEKVYLLEAMGFDESILTDWNCTFLSGPFFTIVDGNIFAHACYRKGTFNGPKCSFTVVLKYEDKKWLYHQLVPVFGETSKITPNVGREIEIHELEELLKDDYEYLVENDVQMMKRLQHHEEIQKANRSSHPPTPVKEEPKIQTNNHNSERDATVAAIAADDDDDDDDDYWSSNYPVLMTEEEIAKEEAKQAAMALLRQNLQSCLGMASLLDITNDEFLACCQQVANQ